MKRSPSAPSGATNRPRVPSRDAERCMHSLLAEAEAGLASPRKVA